MNRFPDDFLAIRWVVGDLILLRSDRDGWLRCDGSEVSRSTYRSLFDVIGTNWGTGDGITTFNLPELTSKGQPYQKYIRVEE